MEFKKVIDYVEKHKVSHFRDILKKNLEITNKKGNKNEGGLYGDNKNQRHNEA
ncbi:hypothetical protein [Bacillus cereus group sp. BfR-BA-02730]|uniref:hypothetical protein n=1 Tax=Bacillus cereus group sp. BfR-BA-02730 TaxID=3094893 RepID=UPI0029C201DA|nr:hypothetical protein [Bacillus cereus group sp. BfR-BA-02730]MDX5808585.1 hypothetical protein [Bacillus cereus group sp. BfR-BA-02730]